MQAEIDDHAALAQIRLPPYKLTAAKYSNNVLKN